MKGDKAKGHRAEDDKKLIPGKFRCCNVFLCGTSFREADLRTGAGRASATAPPSQHTWACTQKNHV